MLLRFIGHCWHRSLPVRGAWIEILPYCGTIKVAGSLPVRGAWIEILLYTSRFSNPELSLPVRGAWIEIESPSPNGRE